MSTAMPQSSFTSGEIAPDLYGRVDFAKYYAGLKTCRNMMVQQFGGVVNRPGSRYCFSVKDMTKRVRLVPFVFSPSQQYIIEFGHHYARIIYNGALVVDGSNNPIVVTTPYSSAALFDPNNLTDLDLLKYTQSNDVMTLCRQTVQPQQLERTSATSWALTPFVNQLGPFEELNTVTTTTVKASATTGNGITLTSNVALFLPIHVGLLFKMQEMPDDNTPAWEVAVSINVNDIVISGANYYQAQNSGTSGTIQPTQTDGTQTDGNAGILWKYLHSGFGIAQITAVTNSMNATANVVSYLPDSIVAATVTHNIAGLVPAVPITINDPLHGFLNGATVTIAGVTGTTGANGTWTITVVDANNYTLDGSTDTTAYTGGGTVTNTTATTPSYIWGFAAWGGDQGYPMSTGFYQQRQIFSATQGLPSTMWFSTVTGYDDFSVSVPTLDDDALTFTLFSRKATEIRHTLELTALIFFTTDGPFVAGSSNTGSTAITPTTMSLKRQGQNGVAHLPPVLIEEGALFVQEKGSQVRSLGYSFQQDAFVGQDITILSNHLFTGHTIVDWTFQEIPNSTVWVVREDGVLLGLTYLPKQEVVAWHRHDTNGLYESVCAITENGVDILYASVKRQINGSWVRFIERFDKRDFTDIQDCYFLDCGLTYDGPPATVFSGLDYLDGMTVSILADGAVYPPQVVVNGSVSIPNPAQVVHVGLPYVSDLETLNISNAQSSLQDKKKLIKQVSLSINNTSYLKAGCDFDHLMEMKVRQFENYGQPTNLQSGVVDVYVQTVWQKPGNVCVRQDQPLPLEILSIIPQVETGGV